MAKLIEDFLCASLSDQSQVTVWFNGIKLTGVVVQIDAECLELRQDQGRSVVRLSQIDAVTAE